MLAPIGLREAAEKIDVSYLEMDPDALEERVKPTRVLCHLKQKLWYEYNGCFATGGDKKIKLSKVLFTVCSRDFFYKRILTNQMIVAWLLNPPAEIAAINAELLTTGYKELRRMLSDPSRGERSEARKIKIMEILLSREKKGPTTAIVNQIRVSLADESSESLQRQMKKLSSETKHNHKTIELIDGK